MYIEQKINYQLNKYPKIKKTIKSIYQHGMYAFSKKIKSEGNIIRISPDDSEHEYFFGYYDKSPWDITDRYMLCLRTKDTWSVASPKEKADILLIDTEKAENDSERIKKIAETKAWNVQQACMLQWLGPDYGSKIIYNDYRNDRYVSVILTLPTMEERIINAPVYTVSSNGKFALTLDFSRLYNLRPGYGYYNVPERTKGIALPDTTAIWKINLENGEITDLLKYTDFAFFQPRSEMQEKSTIHKVNHLMLSPDASRFMVLYRWINGQRKYTRLITCNIDGTDMYVLSDDDMVSHCCWKNNSTILAFENKKKTGAGYYLMKDKTNKYIHCWPQFSNDGHPSYSPDGRLIVTDSYPDRTRIASINLMDGDERKRENTTIAKVFAPFKYDNDTRCDLHPRWNHKGNKICFDAVFENHRGLYIVDLKVRCMAKKIKVLYISDSLKQRFGVTAVIMNYFRNIDRERVQIDFLVFNDSEENIIKEIKEAGSNVYFMPKLSLKNVKEFISFQNEFFSTHKDYKIVHSHFNQIDFIVFPIAKKQGVKHCISHSHNTKYSDFKIRTIRNRIMCLPLKYVADVWAACGKRAGEFLYGKNFINNSKHYIINNAIDIDKFKYDEAIRKEKRTEFNITDQFVIGNVGSFKVQKNQKFLLQIFANLLRNDKNYKYKLMLVGDGDLKYDLQKQAHDLGVIKDVIFTGVRNDVNELLQAMDIFVLPSIYEGLPVVGVEAQASGLSCLFSKTITKEVNICNAQYIDLKNQDKWIQEIKKARNFERINCLEIIKKKGFSIHQEADRLCQFYENL